MPMMPFKNILLMLSANYKMLFHVELSVMLSDSLTFSRYTITSSALCRAIKYYNIFKIIDVASYFPELPSIFLAKEYYCMAILFVISKSHMR